jgi:hypothetical protein
MIKHIPSLRRRLAAFILKHGKSMNRTLRFLTIEPFVTIDVLSGVL